MSDMNGILVDELEIVGFNGAPQVECGLSLPVVRRKSNGMHCVLNTQRTGGAPSWHDEEEVAEFAIARRWTQLSRPLSVPRSCVSDTSQRLSRQPMVVFAARSFLDAACVATWPDTFRDEVFTWQTLEPNEGSIQAACGSAEIVEALLDHWAGALKQQFDAMRQRGQDRASLKRVADFMLCAAEDRSLRWQAYLRYAMAQEPEKVRPTFDAFVRPEFPNVSWEAYLDEIKDLGEVLKSVPVAEPGEVSACPPVTARSHVRGIANRRPIKVMAEAA